MIENKLIIDDENNSDDFVVSYNDRLRGYEKEIAKIIQFPFDNYFVGDIKGARMDLIISWILNYPYEHFPIILLAYDLSIKNAEKYLESYNKIKKTQLELPPELPDGVKVQEFRKEYRKLPLATRLHLFDVLSYSRFTKKPKLRLISNMTLFETRKIGIDEHESANILRHNNLMISLPDGTGYINPAYLDTISIAADFAKGMIPVYREWSSDVSDKLSGLYD